MHLIGFVLSSQVRLHFTGLAPDCWLACGVGLTRKDWKTAAASTAIFAIVDFIAHITARLALCLLGYLKVLELLLPKMRPSCGHMTM